MGEKKRKILKEKRKPHINYSGSDVSKQEPDLHWGLYLNSFCLQKPGLKYFEHSYLETCGCTIKN